MAHFPGANGAASGRGVLQPDTLALMRRPHASQFGAEVWGLGTILFAANGDDDFVIGHDGNNTPAINTATRLNPSTGDGIVVLETGSPLLSTRVAGEWVLWQTGVPDVLTVVQLAGDLMVWTLAGWGVLAVIGIVAGWWLLRRHRDGAGIGARLAARIISWFRRNTEDGRKWIESPGMVVPTARWRAGAGVVVDVGL